MTRETPVRAPRFLARFPADQRSAIGQIFARAALRAPGDPAAALAGVEAEINARGNARHVPDFIRAIAESLAADQSAALEFARAVIAEQKRRAISRSAEPPTLGQLARLRRAGCPSQPSNRHHAQQLIAEFDRPGRVRQ